MAQNLHINILAKDRTKAALGSVQRGLGNLRGALFSIQSALIGIGGALVIRSFVKTGAEVENLRVRFAFLFKGMEEGNKAFGNLIDFAAKVPFSLEEISSASGNLAVVSKDAEELSKILGVVGNVAVVTGLDFNQTAEQIQRSFSGGIAAADVFREKGVRNMLGFEAGAKKTAKETKEAFFKVFGPDGEFGKAMEVMAVTFTGTLSMLSDKLFKFKLQTNEAGFFDFIKSGLAVANNMIESNSDLLQEFAISLSNTMITVLKQTALGVARLLDLFKVVFQVIGLGIGGLIDIVKALPAGIRELGIIGFLMLGRRGKILVAAISALLKFMKVDLDAISEKIFGAQDGTESWGKASEATANLIAKIEKHMKLSKEQMEKLLGLAGKLNDKSIEIGVNFGKVAELLNEKIKKDFENINHTITNFINVGIKGFSKSLAEAIVLGKELNVSLKELAQRLLVDILAFGIQIVIQEQLRNFLIDKGVISAENQKRTMSQIFGINVADLLIHKGKSEELAKQTNEMEKQKKIKGTMQLMSGNPAGFLGFMASGGSVGAGKPYVVGERGPELFIPNQQGQITQNARGMGGESVNVSFNINTIDSRGFEEALNENRGTITAIINDAVNEKGRGNVI